MRLLPTVLAVVATACSSPSGPTDHTEFLVALEDERFVLRTSDPETIRLATENLNGRNAQFPIGPLRRGDGGFNPPWSWHFDPAQVRMTEVAIELCDGRPSHVEAHLDDYPSYCPWGARVVGVNP